MRASAVRARSAMASCFVRRCMLALMQSLLLAAITKRVLGLLAVVLLGGAALFYLGLSSLR
jgi:hypothetical protein